jgi:hypothetical protein
VSELLPYLLVAVSLVLLRLGQAVAGVLAVLKADKKDLPAVVRAVMRVRESTKPDEVRQSEKPDD